DLFDNVIDSIRLFSPDTQTSIKKINEIRLLPAKEFPLTELAIDYFRQTWRRLFTGNPLASPIYQDISEGIASAGIEYYLPLFFEKTETLFDYLPSNTFAITIGDSHMKAIEFWQEIESRYEQRRHDQTHPLLPPESFFLSPSVLKNKLDDYPT